jgi:hypothetical protein
VKEATVADLTVEALYKNRFNAKVKLSGKYASKKGKIVVVHRIRGIATEGVLKQGRKVLDFLNHHSLHLRQRN